MKMICEFSDLRSNEILNFESFFKQKDFFVYTHDFPGQFFLCQGEQWVNFVRENWLHRLQNSQC